jgi:hypothetical protein
MFCDAAFALVPVSVQATHNCPNQPCYCSAPYHVSNHNVLLAAAINTPSQIIPTLMCWQQQVTDEARSMFLQDLLPYPCIRTLCSAALLQLTLLLWCLLNYLPGLTAYAPAASGC